MLKRAEPSAGSAEVQGNWELAELAPAKLHLEQDDGEKEQLLAQAAGAGSRVQCW